MIHCIFFLHFSSQYFFFSKKTLCLSVSLLGTKVFSVFQKCHMSRRHFINGTFAPVPTFSKIPLSAVHDSHQSRPGKGCCHQKVFIIFQEGNIKSKEADQFHDILHKGECPWQWMTEICKMYAIIKIVTMGS